VSKLQLKLTEHGVAVGSPEQGFVELRLTKDGVVQGVPSHDGGSGPMPHAEIELTEKGIVVRDPNSTPEFQELILTKDGLIKAGPGNS
jgi:hypothetical protein